MKQRIGEIAILTTIYVYASFSASYVAAAADATGTDTTASSSIMQVSSPTPEEIAKQNLEAQIRFKNQELDSIKKAIEKTEIALQTTQNQKASLSRDLQILKIRKDELTKNIRADEISLKKLSLEIQSITFDIQDIKGSLADKKHVIAKLIKMIQRNDNVSILSTMLAEKTLADGIMEAQNLQELNTRLSLDVANLNKLRAKLDGKLGDLTVKQSQVKIQNQNLKYRKLILSDQESQRKVLLAQTKDQESIYQRHLRDVLERQKAITAEMETLDAQLRGEINTSELPGAGKIFIYPVQGGFTTQGYGATSFAKYGYPGKWHNGLDFRASIGTPISAAAAGKVQYAGDQDKYCPRGAYGRYVIISHPNNLTTLYAHLSRVAVEPGQTVAQGDIIGYAGSTGYATGPHLHFTVYASNTFRMRESKYCRSTPQGGDLDPQKYL